MDCVVPEHEIMNLWSMTGPDGDVCEDRVGLADNCGDADWFAGGLQIRMDLFDELVVMRFAQLIEDRLLDETLLRVADPNSAGHGNFGSWELLKKMGLNPDEEFSKLMANAREFRERMESEPLEMD